MRRSGLPPLNALYVSDVAAQSSSFRETADKLNLPVGSVSRFVRQIETDLGVTLFERMNRGTALTAEGEAYFAAVKPALEQIREASLALKPRTSDTVTIWSTQTTGALWLMPRFGRLRDLIPGIKIKLVFSSDCPMLEDSGIDLAIGPDFNGDFARQGLSYFHCYDERLTAVCAPQMLKKAAIGDLAAFLTASSLFTSRSMMDEWRAWLTAAGVPVDILEQASMFETSLGALDAARSGEGIALGELRAIRDLLQEGRLTPVDANLTIRGYPVGIHWSPETQQRAVVEEIGSALLQLWQG